MNSWMSDREEDAAHADCGHARKLGEQVEDKSEPVELQPSPPDGKIPQWSGIKPGRDYSHSIVLGGLELMS